MKGLPGVDRNEAPAQLKGELSLEPKSSSSWLEVARAVRVGEALLMMGFPFAGAVFGLVDLSVGSVTTVFVSLLALTPISVSVYASNALGGLTTDRVDPKFEHDPRFDGSLAPVLLRRVVILGLVAGLALGLAVSVRFAIALAVLWVLWLLYSRPGGLKSVPGAGTVVHLVGGGLMFLAPYVNQRPLDDRGVLMSMAFALAFAAGHAHHEIMDRRTDAVAGIRTGATVWGPRPVVWLGLVFAGACYLSIGIAWWAGTLSSVQVAPFAVSLPLHLGFGAVVLMAGDIDLANQQYQKRYRVVFGGAVGLSLVATIAELVLR